MVNAGFPLLLSQNSIKTESQGTVGGIITVGSTKTS